MSFIEENVELEYTHVESPLYKQKYKELNNALYGDEFDDEDKDTLVSRYGYDAVEKINKKGKQYLSKASTQTPIEIQTLKDAQNNPFPNKNFYIKDIPMELGSLFNQGNMKTGANTIIFNLNAALECPSKKYCAVLGACYAVNDEKRGHGTMGHFQNQNTLYLAEKKGKIGLILELLELYIADCYFEGNIIDAVRLNESGDFKTPGVLKALDDWAGKVKNGFICQKYRIPGVKVCAYTAQASPEFIEAFANVKNLMINVSLPQINVGNSTMVKKGFEAVTKAKYDSLPDTYLTPDAQGNDRAVIKRAPDDGSLYYKCPCGNILPNGLKTNCRLCRICYTGLPGFFDGNPKKEVRAFKIYIPVHGAKKGQFNSKLADKRRDNLSSEERPNIFNDYAAQYRENESLKRIKRLMEAMNSNPNRGAIICN